MGSMSPQPRFPAFACSLRKSSHRMLEKFRLLTRPTFPEEAGRLFFTARIERPPLYRGGSASKKNGLPASSYPSEATRCASKGIVQLPQSPFFSILLTSIAHLEH